MYSKIDNVWLIPVSRQKKNTKGFGWLGLFFDMFRQIKLFTIPYLFSHHRTYHLLSISHGINVLPSSVIFVFVPYPPVCAFWFLVGLIFSFMCWFPCWVVVIAWNVLWAMIVVWWQVVLYCGCWDGSWYERILHVLPLSCISSVWLLLSFELLPTDVFCTHGIHVLPLRFGPSFRYKLIEHIFTNVTMSMICSSPNYTYFNMRSFSVCSP